MPEIEQEDDAKDELQGLGIERLPSEERHLFGQEVLHMQVEEAENRDG